MRDCFKINSQGLRLGLKQHCSWLWVKVPNLHSFILWRFRVTVALEKVTLRSILKFATVTTLVTWSLGNWLAFMTGCCVFPSHDRDLQPTSQPAFKKQTQLGNPDLLNDHLVHLTTMVKMFITSAPVPWSCLMTAVLNGWNSGLNWEGCKLKTACLGKPWQLVVGIWRIAGGW